MKSKETKERFDIYSMITDRIIEQLNKGVIPWNKPWTGTSNGAISRSTGRPYSLINQIMLEEPGEYVTLRQVQNEKGKVNKGAKSHIVVFWKLYKKEETDESGEKTTRTIPVLRYYRVFGVDDTTLDPKYYGTENLPEPIEPDKVAEKIILEYINNNGPHYTSEKSNRAFYVPSTDSVVVPAIEQFSDKSEYYSTAFHELTHSTGHKSRLDRFEEGAKSAAFGSTEYSKEELTAEIGAATLNNICGIETPESFRNSTAYCQGWANHLKGNVKEIVGASARAEKAVNWILNGKPEK